MATPVSDRRQTIARAREITRVAARHGLGYPRTAADAAPAARPVGGEPGGLGEVGEQHGEPQPDHDLQVEPDGLTAVDDA